MSAEIAFGKDQIDSYLKEVAKQYRKLNRKGMPAEITLIGGASILINYGFRDSTWPLREFCVSDFRQNQEYYVINVHDGAYSPWLHLSRKVGTVCAPYAA